MRWEPNRDPHGCARCKQRPRAHPYLGCLCEQCEADIDGMTQSDLDADWAAHTARLTP